MTKNVLKFIFVALLMLSLILVPLVGVSYYDSPSIFEKNAVATNRQFGDGISALLAFEENEENDELELTDETLQNAATTLQERFRALGLSDTDVSVAEDNQLRLDIASSSFIDDIVAQYGIVGHWAITNSSMEELLVAADISDARLIVKNGSYQVEVTFTEAGRQKFYNSTSVAAASGSAYMYLTIDSQYASFITINEPVNRDTYSFQSQAMDPSLVASILKYGELPSTLKVVSSEVLPSKLSNGAIIGIAAVLAVVFVVLCAVLVSKGKMSGLFASLALLADICVFLTSAANGGFQFEYATLAALVCFIILAWGFYFFILNKIGKELKGEKSLSYALSRYEHKMNIKAIWIHAAAFAVALICYMISVSYFYISRFFLVFLYISRIFLLGSVANIVFYFLIFLLSAKALADMQAEKQ